MFVFVHFLISSADVIIHFLMSSAKPFIMAVLKFPNTCAKEQTMEVNV